MTEKPWKGLMKVLWIEHLDKDGTLLNRQENLRNTLHQEGEEFLLRAAFTGGQISTIIPENYYLGLDNRLTINDTDTMDDLIGEPGSGGYERQTVQSSGDFSINYENSHYRAISPIVAFRSLTADWGPVSNLFMTNKSDESGSLITTVALESAISLSIGQSVNMRISLSLRDCPELDS